MRSRRGRRRRGIGRRRVGGAAGTNGTAGSGSGVAGVAGPGTAGTNGTAGSTATTGEGGSTGAAGLTGPAGKGGSTGVAGTGAGGTAVATGGAGGDAPGGGSSGGDLFTIMVQLASAMKSTAPTTVGIVTWSTTASGITSAHIDFGLDTTYGMTAPVDLRGGELPDRAARHEARQDLPLPRRGQRRHETYTSDDQTVTTGAKLSSTPITMFSVKNAAAVPKGFFITSFWQGTGSKVPFIFDTDGDVVWWYTAASCESTDGISHARMSADSQSIWLVNETLQRRARSGA